MDNIALAFSGGGFRAACFSLGSLSYLKHVQYNDKPLLNNVKFISSTSGGSITNLAYSSYIYQGKSFDDCYRFLVKEMEGEKLMARALQILKGDKEWKKRPSKSRNIINAFSIAYDELFEENTLGLYEDNTHKPHLEEICINSTEFTNGLPFRFQSTPHGGSSKGKIGNKYIFFKKSEVAISNKLKLADILASSSCFPSGFEPMIFPNDYSYDQVIKEQLWEAISFKANVFTLPDDKEDRETDEETVDTNAISAEGDEYNSVDLLKDKTFDKATQFGIMDGGVADNQAIDAFKKANNRRAKDKKFDLFISCDVTSYFMDGYTLPLEKKKWYNKISIRTILIIWMLCSLVLPAMLVLVKSGWKGWMYAVVTISGLMLLPVLINVVKKIISLITGKKKDTTFGTIFSKYKGVFLDLRIGAIKQMILSRAKSVFILANDIYLKQIRRMYYDELFSNPNYTRRTIQNAIYDLSRAKFPGKDISSELLHPSEKVVAVAEKARNMGTTLWFDETHQAEKMKERIIATGQFTTCYNLLKYLNKKKEYELTDEIEELKKQLRDDWRLFNEDPFFLMP